MGPLIRSLLTLDNPFNSTEEVLAWIARRNREVEVSVMPISFKGLKGWGFDATTGNLRHESGKFFSIVGIDVYKNQDGITRWRQPIINQPEVGYLGIICKEFDGVLYFLLQAKIEPGNVNCVQLSPTLQATRSNYTCVHGGKRPAYLDYFKNAKQGQILLDQLQSEQGARFFRKRNRNIIIKIDEEIDVGEDFRWLTLGQIKYLMSCDNTVNMDTRTVLSGLRFPAIAETLCEIAPSEIGGAFFESERRMDGEMSIDSALHRVSELKSRYELIVDKIPLARGEFVAICEGDDFWANENKLQCQVDYLTKHLDVSLVHMEVYIQHENSKLSRCPFTHEAKRAVLSYNELGGMKQRQIFIEKGNYIATPTVLTRRSLIANACAEVLGILYKTGWVPSTDFILWYVCMRNGRAIFLNEVGAVRRINAGSLTSIADVDIRKARRIGDVRNLLCLAEADNMPKSDIEHLREKIIRIYSQQEDLGRRKMIIQKFVVLYWIAKRIAIALHLR